MSQWITNRTESSVRKNDQLHRILMENPNPENCVKTKEFHNEVTRMIRDANVTIITHWEKTFSSAKTVYRTLEEKKSTTTQVFLTRFGDC